MAAWTRRVGVAGLGVGSLGGWWALDHADRAQFPAPVVSTTTVNAGSSPDRALCLTVSVALKAAGQCGDLRLIHPLGATRVRGALFTPTLVYNSGVAELRPIVRALVTKPAGASALTQVTATLTVASAVRDSGSWTGTDITSWVSGTTRQLALGFNAFTPTDFGNQALPYTLTVRFHYGANVQATAVQDTLLVVSRRQGYMGTGWWLAGYGRLYPSPPIPGAPPRERLLWVGGDGSARMYTQPVGGQPTWTADRATERPDSIYQQTVGGLSYWFQSIPGGGAVRFNAAGLQDLVVDRFDQQTQFLHTCTDRLSRILLPGGAREYAFAYAGGCGVLQSVAQKAGTITLRTDQVSVNAGTNLVDGITDPSGSTTFAYVGAADAARFGLMTRRIDKRGTWTQFAWDSAGRLRRAATYLGTGATGDSVAWTFASLWEAQGFRGTATVDTAVASTFLDGPRPASDVADTTRFWQARFGNVRRVRDALGQSTWVTYADPRFPALVTRVRDALGFERGAGYDARGRVAADTAYLFWNGQHAVTSYTWTTPCDRVTRITPPVVTQYREFDYNPGACTLAAERNGRGPASQVDYLYLAGGMANGLLQRVTMPADAAGQRAQENYTYDGVGNLRTVTSPVGVVTTAYQDSAGRDTSVSALVAVGVTRTRRTLFDAVGRPTTQETLAGPDRHTVVQAFDGEGMVTTATTSVTPDINALGSMQRAYTYDRALRLVQEGQGSAGGPITVATLTVDLAGNVTNRVRTGSVNDTTLYDALNRPTWYRARTKSQTSTFTYDDVGRLKAADNDFARVRRGYTASGLLTLDTLIVATTDLTAATRWTAHQYVQRFSYDLMGRRTARGYPQQLLAAPAAADSVRYGYDPQTGDATATVDRFGNAFTWTYDNLGRAIGSAASNTPAEVLVYDLNSRLIRRTRNAAGFVRDSLLYTLGDQVSRMLPGTNPTQGDAITYLPIGPVTATQFNNAGSDTYTVDALGNRRQGHTVDPGGQATPLLRTLYAPQTGRLTKAHGFSGSFYPDTTFYTTAQDGTLLSTDRVTYAYLPIGPAPCTGAACIRFFIHRTTDDFYAGAGRLDSVRVTEDSVWGPATTTPKPPTYKPYRMYTKYRYDALGRRVWTRVIRGTNCAAKHVGLPATCRSTLTRSVWDGAALVFEVRVPGDSTATATTLEQDGPAASPYYGRVGYVEGHGLDAPAALFKEGLVVYPYADWRGVYVNGSCFPGPCPTDLQFPGGQGSVGAWGPYGMDPDGAGWYGSLGWAQQDATGRQYKRNRYYDVEAGQFTQEDPIGLAGGLNLYGYANGDPVNFSDPFGLCPPQDTDWGPHCPGWWTSSLELAGAVVGGGVGGFSGGATGAAACAATVVGAIPCAIGGGVAGAAAGARRGALIGAAVGALLEGGMSMARAGKGRGGNNNPNDEANRIANEAGLNRPGQRALHDEISGHDLTADQIRDIAQRLAEQAKYRK